MHYKAICTLVRNLRNFRFTEFSPHPETCYKLLSSSKGVKVMVCWLHNSGSQPFNWHIGVPIQNMSNMDSNTTLDSLGEIQLFCLSKTLQVEFFL